MKYLINKIALILIGLTLAGCMDTITRFWNSGGWDFDKDATECIKGAREKYKGYPTIRGRFDQETEVKFDKYYLDCMKARNRWTPGNTNNPNQENPSAPVLVLPDKKQEGVKYNETPH